MRFESYVPKSAKFEALLVWSLLNILLIVMLAYGVRSFFLTGEAGLDLRLPRAVARTPADRASFVVIIDLRGRLYWQGRNVSLEAFERELGRAANPKTQILIKADRRASLDVLSAIWDACRRHGVGRVTMATNE